MPTLQLFYVITCQGGKHVQAYCTKSNRGILTFFTPNHCLIPIVVNSNKNKEKNNPDALLLNVEQHHLPPFMHSCSYISNLYRFLSFSYKNRHTCLVIFVVVIKGKVWVWKWMECFSRDFLL